MVDINLQEVFKYAFIACKRYVDVFWYPLQRFIFIRMDKSGQAETPLHINKYILSHNYYIDIFVTGQVSSGKSTLLNLFLGDDVLPTHLRSCTAAICEIQYADHPRANVRNT